MKNLFSLLFFLVAVSGFGQAIGSLNLNYLYNPQNEIDLQMKMVKGQNQIKIYYSFQVNTVQFTPESCSIIWQKRDSFSQREGTDITPEELQTPTLVDGKKTGILTFPIPEKPWLLVAKVNNATVFKSWTYFKTIEANYPVNEYLMATTSIVSKPYIASKNEYTIHGSGSKQSLRVSFYKNIFNPASPPFVESESTVDRFLFHDSTFIVNNEQKIKFRSHGLYLLQEDTIGVEGLAFRSGNEAYPKYTRVED